LSYHAGGYEEQKLSVALKAKLARYKLIKHIVNRRIFLIINLPCIGVFIYTKKGGVNSPPFFV